MGPNGDDYMQTARDISPCSSSNMMYESKKAVEKDQVFIPQ